MLLSDVPEPNKDKTTFTINIPKCNRLDRIDWTEIYEYVRDVTNRKLSVRERKISIYW